MQNLSHAIISAMRQRYENENCILLDFPPKQQHDRANFDRLPQAVPQKCLPEEAKKPTSIEVQPVPISNEKNAFMQMTRRRPFDSECPPNKNL